MPNEGFWVWEGILVKDSQAWETINFPKAQNPHALLSVECSRGTRATHTFWPVFMQSLSHNSNKMKRWSTSKYWRKTLYTWSNMYCTSMFADRTINHNNQTQYSNSNTVSSATSSKLENNYQRGKELALSPFTVVWGGIGPRSVISTFVTGTSVVWLFVCVCLVPSRQQVSSWLLLRYRYEDDDNISRSQNVKKIVGNFWDETSHQTSWSIDHQTRSGFPWFRKHVLNTCDKTGGNKPTGLWWLKSLDLYEFMKLSDISPQPSEGPRCAQNGKGGKGHVTLGLQFHWQKKHHIYGKTRFGMIILVSTMKPPYGQKGPLMDFQFRYW